MASQRLAGILLVALGIALFVLFQVGVGPEAIPLLIGAGFLVAYAVTRSYGFLIPGGILTGLGTGIVVAAAGGSGGAPVLGLGIGFLTIAVIDRLVRGATPGFWWPLIPGGILTAVGLTATPGTRELMPLVGPAALVVAGLLLLLSRRRPAASAQRTQAAPAPTPTDTAPAATPADAGPARTPAGAEPRTNDTASTE
jgi:hypothetical protein